LAGQGLTDKLPRSHLVNDGEFDFSWAPAAFDFVLAQSVFTHLPLNRLRLCLERLHSVVAPGSSFYATIFEVPETHPVAEAYRHQCGITSFDAEDPFHCRFSDVGRCCQNLPWTAVHIGDWKHPRSQHMIEFVRSA